MIIAIDFDGTCVSHEFPRMGKSIGAEPVLRELVSAGHTLMLWTVRTNGSIIDSEIDPLTGLGHAPVYDPLGEAVDWFSKNSIALSPSHINHSPLYCGGSPKQYADLYIDDRGLGIPLKSDPSVSLYPFVDWEKVRELLVNLKII